MQRAQLPHLQVLYRRHEVAKQDVALLTDRVRVHLHQIQVYATRAPIEDRKIVLGPIEDPTHLERRHTAIGWVPMPAYQCMLPVMYFPLRPDAAAAASSGTSG